MSENFRGITFAEQSVTPADDAIVRRAILPDGTLTGCEISYSGSTLTMAAGFIIACGRTFQHTTAQNWAVVDATSGFARLVLTIDLTKTATESTFDQINTAIEYATSEDGFVALEQQDINLSGTRYQIVAAVVSLGTGGITGIVSQLQKSQVEGGGLNFSVVDGLTQPGDPKENMIWVYTEGMTGWYLAAEQPEEMAEGEVWISTGTASQVAFNVLKKGTVMVYPMFAKQMVDGVLDEVTAYIWKNGTWVELLSTLYIFKEGEGIHPDYTVNSITGVTGFLVENDKITTGDYSQVGGAVWIDPKVDLDPYNYLYVELKCTKYGANKTVTIGVGPDTPTSVSAYGSYDASSSVFSAERKIYQVPISALSDKRFVKVCGNACCCEIYNIWLDK